MASRLTSQFIRSIRYSWIATLAIFFLSIFSSECRAQESGPAPIQPKFALLIGNGDYDGVPGFTPRRATHLGKLSDLRNPCNDVTLIQRNLIRLGWSERNIIIKCDVTTVEIISAMQEFADDFMTGEFPFGFIYYAGHGAQVDRDTYIFGTDAENDIDNVVNRYSHSPDANLFRGGIKFRDEILEESLKNLPALA
jgi:hypothetical protein